MNKKYNITALKMNFIIFILAFILAVLYLGSRELLAFGNLYYRTWLIIIGEVITFLVVPLVAIALPVTGCMGLMSARKNTEEKQNKKGGTIATVIVSAAMVIIAILYLLVGGIWYLFVREETIEEESYFTSDIIEGVSQGYVGWESHNIYEYYTPVSFFLKKTYEPRWEIIELRAKQEYGEVFCVEESDKAREEQGGVTVYTLYMESDPGFTFHMFAGNGLYEFSDDYPQVRANYIFSQNEAFCEIADFPEPIDTSKATDPSNSFITEPYVRITEGEQAEDISEIVMEAIDEVMADPFLRENQWTTSIGFRLIYEDGTTEETRIRIHDEVTQEYVEDVIRDMCEKHENH